MPLRAGYDQDEVDEYLDEVVDALDLDEAHAAGANLVDILQIAQVRNVYIQLRGSLKYRRALRHGDGLCVYNEIYHISLRPPLNIP